MGIDPSKERKKLAEELLTKGYIEATPENLKEYFDAIIFSGRNNEYYTQQGLDFMNPNDCVPQYSIADYIEMLTQNHIIDENSFFREIGTSIKESIPSKQDRKSGLDDCMQDDGVRISMKQGATQTVKTVLNKDKVLDVNEHSIQE